MLDIDISPARGILFVKLSGFLDEHNVMQFTYEVLDFIKKTGIKNAVFNVSDVRYMDFLGRCALINSFNFCLNNDGFSFICVDANEKIKNMMLKFFDENFIVNDEISAVKIINS